MTTEEKAKEICNAYANSKFIPTPEECVVYSSAMAMAEWKDEQFKKVIEYAEICYGVFSFNEKENFINKIKKLYKSE